MSYPDVSMNYIKSPLFLDVSIEIAKSNSRDLWFLFFNLVVLMFVFFM